MKNTAKSIRGFFKALLLPIALYAILLVLIPDRIGNLNSIHIMLIMSVVPAIMAYGVSFGFVSGVMDFSIGSRVVFSGLVGAVCAKYFGFFGLLLGCVLTSVLLAVIVGGVYRLLRIPSLVVSLGMLMLFEVAGSKFSELASDLWPDISTGYYIKVPEELSFLGTSPGNLIVLALVMVLYGFVYYRTKFSNQSRVVGSDELIARNVGIDPMKVKFQTYVVGGVFLGLASMVSACYSGAVGAQTNMATMSAVFRPIMAVVISMALSRLVPIPIGIFLGCFSLNIIFTGIIALGWSDNLQNVLLGFFLVVVVAFPKVMSDIRTARRRRHTREAFAKAMAGQGVQAAACGKK